MDEPERDKFYTAPEATTDDDEYELEPPDPAVVSAQDSHGKNVSESARLAVDIDEIYREAERERGTEIVEQWIRNFRLNFRFQTKHLLIATAVLSIVLSLATLGILWQSLGILVMLSVAGLYLYLHWEEQKQLAEADRKRDELYARRRDKLRAQGIIPGGNQPARPLEPAPVAVLPSSTEDDSIWKEAAPTREPFRFQFSMREMMIVMTSAAVILGLMQVLGGAAPTATILGFVALTGLIIHAIGIDPPKTVVLGWWFILVFYVLLSIFAAVWTGSA